MNGCACDWFRHRRPRDSFLAEAASSWSATGCRVCDRGEAAQLGFPRDSRRESPRSTAAPGPLHDRCLGPAPDDARTSAARSRGRRSSGSRSRLRVSPGRWTRHLTTARPATSADLVNRWSSLRKAFLASCSWTSQAGGDVTDGFSGATSGNGTGWRAPAAVVWSPVPLAPVRSNRATRAAKPSSASGKPPARRTAASAPGARVYRCAGMALRAFATCSRLAPEAIAKASSRAIHGERLPSCGTLLRAAPNGAPGFRRRWMTRTASLRATGPRKRRVSRQVSGSKGLSGASSLYPSTRVTRP